MAIFPFTLIIVIMDCMDYNMKYKMLVKECNGSFKSGNPYLLICVIIAVKIVSITDLFSSFYL